MEILIEGPELRDLDRSLSREWYLADGTGGYAASTVPGANTRKYHGLLVVPRNPPAGKEVHLALLEEEVAAGGSTWHLSTFLYEGAIHPRGFEHLERFAFDGLSATWEFRFGDLRVRKRLRRLPNAVEIEYWTSKSARLTVRPLVTRRSAHGLRRAPGAPPDLHLRLRPGSRAAEGGPHYWNFLYPCERERGYDAVEDLLNAGTLEGPVGPGGATFEAWVGPRPPAKDPRPEKPPRAHPLLQWLWRSSASFLARRDGGWTVVAGHPWFDDWGRDTFVSLPGLALTTRRYDVARSILETWTARMEGGVVPNLFTDGGPDYRSADATLWLFHALGEYFRETRDRRLLARLYPQLEASVEAHLSGTPAGVRADPDGLLRCPPGLTWMDARVGNVPVTPRGGKPVEVEALWHNALRTVESFARALKRDPAPYAEMAARAAASFRQKFIARTGLLDVAEPDDPRLRPNGLVAISLPHALFGGPQAESYLRAVEGRLLTPFGPRTLDPADPDYRGRYAGSPEERDRAYHQGAVWPWLLGPYLSAVLRVRGPAAARRLRPLFEPFLPHLREAGLGTVSEVFDGDPPHRPGGCPSQAWSVAELLRSGRPLLR
ncbi:MAG: amylo-alpha-1,6-glucosidase [Halobacteria archaeon]